MVPMVSFTWSGSFLKKEARSSGILLLTVIFWELPALSLNGVAGLTVILYLASVGNVISVMFTAVAPLLVMVNSALAYTFWSATSSASGLLLGCALDPTVTSDGTLKEAIAPIAMTTIKNKLITSIFHGSHGNGSYGFF